MKRIVLCADDYGQAPHISQAILALVRLSRLSAVSCMVNQNDWQEHAPKLKEMRDHVRIGLHFNLTEGKPLSKSYIKTYGTNFYSLARLLCAASLRQLNLSVIEDECRAQINQFFNAMGFLPNHIDGHQHVHQFPIIRNAIINVYEQDLRAEASYIRLVNEKIKSKEIALTFKKIIIYASGTKALQRLLIRHHIPHNKSFTGIYDFTRHQNNYRQLFQAFLRKTNDEGMIMCHPGLSYQGTQIDPIADARTKEYTYFGSDDFLQDCEGANVKLSFK